MGTGRRRKTTQTECTLLCRAINIALFFFFPFFLSGRYERGSWLTLHVESSVLIKRLKIAFYLCAVLWAVLANTASRKDTAVTFAASHRLCVLDIVSGVMSSGDCWRVAIHLLHMALLLAPLTAIVGVSWLFDAHLS